MLCLYPKILRIRHMGRKQQAKRATQTQTASDGQPMLASKPSGKKTKDKRKSVRGIDRLLGLPRLTRILLITLPTIAAALLATPIVDGIYLRYFYSATTVGVPAIIIMVIALAVFIMGWVLYVGDAGVEVPERRALYWYILLAGILMLSGSLYFSGLMIENIRGA